MDSFGCGEGGKEVVFILVVVGVFRGAVVSLWFESF